MSTEPESDKGGRLLADVGGTHARFAWQPGSGEPLQCLQVVQVSAFAGIEDAIAAYLAELGCPVSEAAIAIANPVLGDQVQMTNHHWAFSQRGLRQRFGWVRLRVLNDFSALALALPTLGTSERRQIGGGLPVAGAPLALLGAGTGLGVSGLLPDGRGAWMPLSGEGGHVTWAAVTAREQVVREGLSLRHGHVSAERVASGQGLADVFAVLCMADGLTPPADLTPSDVSEAALVHGHPQALEALGMFAATLGMVAGDLVLTLGARGGVYLGGGIVPRLGDWFDRSPFRERFESKGRFTAYLSSVPAWVITAEPSPALRGASCALDAERG